MKSKSKYNEPLAFSGKTKSSSGSPQVNSPQELFPAGSSFPGPADSHPCGSGPEDASYLLDYGPLQVSFNFITNIYGRPALMVMLRRETQFFNVRWMRLIVFHWREPWFTNKAGVITD